MAPVSLGLRRLRWERVAEWVGGVAGQIALGGHGGGDA